MSQAQKELTRLQDIQRERRSKLKTIFKSQNKDVDMMDERAYHTPKFFTKTVTQNPETGKTEYDWTPNGKYWKMRETGNWAGVPKIFDNNQEPFY